MRLSLGQTAKPDNTPQAPQTFDQSELFRVPLQLHAPMLMYVDYGIIPQDEFLRAILENDYRVACATSTPATREYLYNIFIFLTRCLPAKAWGSREAILAWNKRGGLKEQV
jgi:hypothetical protein